MSRWFLGTSRNGEDSPPVSTGSHNKKIRHRLGNLSEDQADSEAKPDSTIWNITHTMHTKFHQTDSNTRPCNHWGVPSALSCTHCILPRIIRDNPSFSVSCLTRTAIQNK